MNENGDYMLIAIYSSKSSEIASDIEYSDYEETTINGNTAYIFYDEKERIGSLITGNEYYTIWISSISEKSEMIKVAENIK